MLRRPLKIFFSGLPVYHERMPLPCPGTALWFRPSRSKASPRGEAFLKFELPPQARRVVPFWNVQIPTQSWIRVELGLPSLRGKQKIFQLARWGRPPMRKSYRSSKQGKDHTEIDSLFLDPSPGPRRIEIRLHSPRQNPARIFSLGLTWTGVRARSRRVGTLPKVHVAIPAYSQFQAPTGLAERLCSPTCLSMALASFLGKKVNLLTTARNVYDPEADIFGNWSFNVAHGGEILRAAGLDLSCAASFLPDLQACVPYLQKKRPVILSLSYGPHQMPGAPLHKTPGHLIVLRGFDGRGHALVCDPAAKNPLLVRRAYPVGPLNHAWARSGRFAYIFPSPSLFPAPAPYRDLRSRSLVRGHLLLSKASR